MQFVINEFNTVRIQMPIAKWMYCTQNRNLHTHAQLEMDWNYLIMNAKIDLGTT